MKAPDFWKKGGALLPTLCLSPLAALYGFATRRRWKVTTPAKPNIPVICIGNAVMGGAGKTPLAMALAQYLVRQGRKPHFLSRGYLGELAKNATSPIRVVPSKHSADEVGDEPLMLAAVAPTWVTPDRPAGAKAAEAAGADIIIMDDGFQNPSLAKDLNILVIDGGFGFGNGRVFPAGPLREPSSDALARADAALIYEPDRHDIRAALPEGLPAFSAKLVPQIPPVLAPKQPVLPFCGIGRPEKFFESLAEAGLDIVDSAAFPDHHLFKESELTELADRARMLDATLVTTEKDAVRNAKRRRYGIIPIGVAIEFADKDAEAHLLAPVLQSKAPRHRP